MPHHDARQRTWTCVMMRYVASKTTQKSNQFWFLRHATRVNARWRALCGWAFTLTITTCGVYVTCLRCYTGSTKISELSVMQKGVELQGASLADHWPVALPAAGPCWGCPQTHVIGSLFALTTCMSTKLWPWIGKNQSKTNWHKTEKCLFLGHYVNHSRGVRKYFFAERVVGPWNSLPTDTDFGTLKRFKQSIKSVDFKKFLHTES